MSESTTNTTSPQISILRAPKRRIVKASEYEEICDFISHHQGLAIDCELDLLRQFPQFEKLTLKCILQTILTNRMRSQYWIYDANANNYLKK